ncbi:MAG: hypothetical protein R2766_04670 [Saprospiraceae bacterium]
MILNFSSGTASIVVIIHHGGDDGTEPPLLSGGSVGSIESVWYTFTLSSAQTLSITLAETTMSGWSSRYLKIVAMARSIIKVEVEWCVSMLELMC